MSSESLSLQEAADRLGVHYMTMYRYVRLGLIPARKEGGSWRVQESDLAAPAEPTEPRPVRGSAPWSQRVEARMVAGDVTGAWAVMEAAMASGTAPSEVYSDLLAPALVSIGERWASGELGVDGEHLASAVAARLIGRLGPRFNRRGRSRGTVVTAMPSGERHGLGLAMLADVIRGEGFSVLDLGPDTPPATLVAAMRKAEDVRAVCLSVVYSEALPHIPEMIGAVRQEFDAIPVILGGHAVHGLEQAIALGADAWARDASTVAGLIDELAHNTRTG
jgi:excisionase family DNA binding protein